MINYKCHPIEPCRMKDNRKNPVQQTCRRNHSAAAYLFPWIQRSNPVAPGMCRSFHKLKKALPFLYE